MMPDELKTAEQLVEIAPDSALHILHKMPAQKTNRTKTGHCMGY